MSICGLHGRAQVDPTNLGDGSAFSTCDRCGFLYNHRDLVWQYEYRGMPLVNIRLLVCTRTCLDEPFIFNQPIILPPDPLPILDARPPFYAVQAGPPPAPGFEQILIDQDNPNYPPSQPPVSPTFPNAYTTEDGVTIYVSEDGSTVYVRE